MLSLYLALISEPSDKEKFNELYTSFKDKMFAVAMAVLHNTALAEEAVSESFFKIAKKFELFSDVYSRKTLSLIVIVVRNASIDILRKERHESNPLDGSSDYHNNVIFPDVRRVIEGGTDALLKAIDSLDAIYSDALKLKYIYGYSNADIAGLLGISEKGAGSRIYRAKIMLKEKLEEMGYEID